MIALNTSMLLLAEFATVTSLLTQKAKKFLDKRKIKYATNILVLVISLAVGCSGTALYYMKNQVPFNDLDIVYLVIMGMANWMVSMFGYDKVKQTIMQITDMGKR